MHQRNGDHEHRASRKFPDPGNSEEGLSTEIRHPGMIRYANAAGEPVTTRHVDPDTGTRPRVGGEDVPGGITSPY